jgi:hypothetical protein
MAYSRWSDARTGEYYDNRNGQVSAKHNIREQAPEYARRYGISETEALKVLQDYYGKYGNTQYGDDVFGGADDQLIAHDKKFREEMDAAFASAKENAGQAAVEGQRQQVTNQLQRYFEMLNSPVQDAQGNYTDPLAKQLVDTGVAVGQKEATDRGIGGALGSTAAMSSAQTALQPYLAQRVQLAGQALQVINQRDLGLEDQRLKADELELQRVGMENDKQSSMWQAQQKNGQAIGSAIGAGVGALGFIGGPVLGAATVAGGSALGAGFGGMAAGGSGPTLSSPRFKNASGNGGKGGW